MGQSALTANYKKHMASPSSSSSGGGGSSNPCPRMPRAFETADNVATFGMG